MLLAVNLTLIKGLVALAPACVLLAGSIIMFLRAKTAPSLLQLVGAGALVLVILTHVFEALDLFAWMHWGDQHSIGHYLDLGGAVAALTLFPLGYLLHVLTNQRI